MADFHKTEKGTILPLMNLKGKPYLMVAHRLVWFREVMPGAAIETNVYEIGESHAIFVATIRDENGKVLATATKKETQKDFPDFIEKAETGAVGRALAMAGFGTAFTVPDFDEGSRLADAPIAPGGFTEALKSIKADAPKASAAPTISAGPSSEGGDFKRVKMGPAKKVAAPVDGAGLLSSATTSAPTATTTTDEGWN